MTTQQRTALNKANLVRLFQADFKRRLREHDKEAGTLMAREVISSPAPELGSLKIETLLCAIRAMGRYRARTLLRAAHVSPTRRLGDLTDNERSRLSGALGNVHPTASVDSDSSVAGQR